jgi:hypothetical protein
MADDVILNPGAGGDTIGADSISGIKYQRIKLIHGADGTNAGDVAAANPLPVVGTGEADGTQNLILSRFLDTTGDGTGTKNAVGDYSGAQTIFKLTPAASTIFRIARLIACYTDTTATTPDLYGAMTALTNGVEVRIHNGTSTVVDLTDGVPIKSNIQWGRHCVPEARTWGAGHDGMINIWDFLSTGQFLRLDGDATEELQVLLNDDFTGLDFQYFMAQGYTENTAT